METVFADIIIPLGVKGTYTYRIPPDMVNPVSVGMRVIVQFGPRRYYTGIIKALHHNSPGENVKDLTEIPDQVQLLSEKNLAFWVWLSDYYISSPGDVMKSAMPSGLFAGSETVVVPVDGFSDFGDLDEASSYIFTLAENKGGVRVKDLPDTVSGRRSIRVVNELVLKGALSAAETISAKYKPKTEPWVAIPAHLTNEKVHSILDSLSKAKAQRAVFESYISLSGYSPGKDIIPVAKSLLLKDSGVNSAALAALEKKGILTVILLEGSRIRKFTTPRTPLSELSPAQTSALCEIREHFEKKDTVLLKGVTSSGKTEIYTHLIEEYISHGKQVLYLLPEIALTTQIIDRLSLHFGNAMGVYHSRLSDSERSEMWRKVSSESKDAGFRLIVGVRSALLLPFRNPGLIIVDEEHDSSYKQSDPAPRYQARDSAIMLASLFGAKVLLGSATPSLESYYNAKAGKYGLVNLTERFGSVNLPEIVLADTREAGRKKLLVSHFTPQLLNAIDKALDNGEQVLLFRNRRGFSPYIECGDCGWVPACSNCAVKMTYHKGFNNLVCHYCGTTEKIPSKCGLCGSMAMKTVGYGTEKIEEEIKIVFPGARVARMDQDSARSKNAFNKIITDFEAHRTDILIGTQMVSKGLDFENLTVVGILNADSMLNFPDFRSYEKAFQMMAQVSGRAGRRQKHGKVIIQTSDPSNRLIRMVLRNSFDEMYDWQMEERKIFNYPPFCRIIKITVKSRDRNKLEEFSSLAGKYLREYFGSRVLGPEYPVISRIQQWYIKNIIIKIEKNKPFPKAREAVAGTIEKLESLPGASSVRFSIDVDPYS